MQFCNPTIIRCFDARCGGIYPAPFFSSEVGMAMRFGWSFFDVLLSHTRKEKDIWAHDWDETDQGYCELK